MVDKKRTIEQNRCLHECFQAWADGLNDGGYSVQEVFTLPVQHTKESIKVNIAYRFIEALYPEIQRDDGTYHTSDLSTTQIQQLFENINRALGEKFGVSITWPDRFNGGQT
jgi:hypothetical protein